MHKVDDDTLVTANLLRWFITEAELEGQNGQHFAVLERDNGSFFEHNPHSPELDEMQAIWARDMLTMLNKELHHDGAWFILFTSPGAMAHLLQSRNEYGRFSIAWMDGDGDVQLAVEWVAGESDELDFADVILSGDEAWAQKCEAAWQAWKILQRDVLDLKEGQTIKRAKGQRSTQH